MPSPCPTRICTALLAGALAGCMTVRIEARDGQVAVNRHVGVLAIVLPDPRTAIVGELSGLGVTGTPMGLSVGYTRQRWALIGPECRAIVWPGARPLDAATARLLAGAAGVCLIEAERPQAALGPVASTPAPTPLHQSQEEQP